MIYVILPVTVMSAVATPAMTGLMANRVPDDAQGELQGVLSASTAIVSIFSPLIMTQLFGAFTGRDAVLYLPGAPFIAGAMIMAVAVLPFAWGLRGARTT